MGKELVSIVITAYNVAEWLERAVRSALSQTWGEVEVIVVEDRSTDGKTPALLRSLLEESGEGGRLRVIWNADNVGAGMGRRIGTQAARGEYVLLLDGDDWLEAGFVEELMEGGGSADIISGGITVHRENGDTDITIYKARTETGVSRIKGHFLERIVFMNNKLIRRSLYEKVPYCGRRYIEDTPTIVPMLYEADRVVFVETAGYHYNLRGGSLTHDTYAVKNHLFRALCIKDLYEWSRSKPREYREMFRLSLFLRVAALIRGEPAEQVRRAAREYPSEWAEFTRYLACVEELRDNITK